MDQRLHFLTLATPDLGAAVAPGLVLGLFDAEKFVEDVEGAITDPSTSGLTLSHNVDSPESVDALVDAALAPGATLVKAPQHAAFGRYHGQFAEPNGRGLGNLLQPRLVDRLLRQRAPDAGRRIARLGYGRAGLSRLCRGALADVNGGLADVSGGFADVERGHAAIGGGL